MRISDWSSDVCSSDLGFALSGELRLAVERAPAQRAGERGDGQRRIEAAAVERASARGDGAVDVAVPAGGEIARVEAVEGGVELPAGRRLPCDVAARIERAAGRGRADRKSTRLNSSH